MCIFTQSQAPELVIPAMVALHAESNGPIVRLIQGDQSIEFHAALAPIVIQAIRLAAAEEI